jgi:predicted AlkP superfamily phosphohydrolase/phosphomutase
MLAILQLDALSLPLVERMLDAGDLPTIAGLAARGEWRRLETPASHFTGATQPTLYSGIELGQHSQFYIHQWSPEEQRIKFRRAFDVPEPAWDRVARAGKRSLAFDPYEGYPPRSAAGIVASGVQFRNYLGVERWSSPASAGPAIERMLGRSPYVEEVFGEPSVAATLALRRGLIAASRRVGDAAVSLMASQRFDLVWLTFLACHIGGHQFWNLSQYDEDALDEPTRQLFLGTLRELYREVDRNVGRVVEALPDDADVIAVSGLGMGENTSRADFLGEMLDVILHGKNESGRAASVPLWRLRAAVPTRARGLVTEALGPRIAREIMARSSVAGVDWSKTRAFAVPSDHHGQIRLNVRGRERDGIVEPEEVDELLDRISTGLLGFRDVGGSESIAAVKRVEEVVGHDTPQRRLLPDLLVQWADTPTTRLTAVESPVYGRVDRPGRGSGRAGGHTDVAWALLAPGASRLTQRNGDERVVDVAATVASLLDADMTGLTGTPLLER